MGRIIAPVKNLAIYVCFFLKIKLSKPQTKHLFRFIEGNLMLEGGRTLSKITRLYCDAPHPSSLADFFTYSPWEQKQLIEQMMKENIKWVVEAASPFRKKPKPLLISFDDSAAPKPAESKHFAPAPMVL